MYLFLCACDIVCTYSRWLESVGFTTPVIVDNKQGLGLQVPEAQKFKKLLTSSFGMVVKCLCPVCVYYVMLKWNTPPFFLYCSQNQHGC